jgi:hypothetical protein
MKRQLAIGTWPLACALMAGIWVIGGCATEPDPLDKTQTESVNKKMFEGEWLYKMTVTDTEYHNDYTFIGEETSTYAGATTKIRWQITQDYLNGYLVPQNYLDADGNLVRNTIGLETMVFSFRIERHFDIRYLQNNTTREELNVIVENTDRPWDQREYMIVDWSRNYATDMWAPTTANIEAGDIVREPVDTWENIEFFNTNDEKVNTKAWRPEKDPDVYAFNIDLQYQIHARLRYWWDIYYGIGQPSLVRYRVSFRKMDPYGVPERTYQPLQYRDEFFRRFGYFRTEFETFDPERGPLESEFQYLANRWDVGCYEDEDTGEETCKQIHWYMSPSMPTRTEDPDLYEWTVDVVEAWNKAFQEATGRTDDVVVLHENEKLLDADGNEILGPSGQPRYRYELGDLRYNFINYVTRPGSSSPLGYGPSTPNPDTGEIVSATVNVYGAWLDVVTTRAIDLYDAVAGRCTLEDLARGHYWNEETEACDGGNPGIFASKKDGQKLDWNFLTPAMKTAYWPKGRVNKPDQPFNRQFAEARRPIAKQAHLDRLQKGFPADLGRFSIAKGTAFERMMVPNASFGSTFPGAQTVDQVRDEWSAASRLSEAQLWSVRKYFERNSIHCRIEPDHFDNNILAFVEEMQGRPRDEVKREIRKWTYYTTTLHEMGHTVGLRHNFRGSVDKVNFRNEYHVAYNSYWTQVEALRAEYAARIASGDPAAYQEYTEKVHKIPSAHERYSGASIMDYHGWWETWLPDAVPAYDRAAILFAYGNKVEVMDGSQWVVRDYEDGDFVKADYFDYATPAASGRNVRYYMNCSDERSWDDAFCTVWDRGTTATEIMQNMIKDSYKTYFLTNFKRNRSGFEGVRAGYYWRKWIYTYFMYAKSFAQVTIHSIWYPEFWDTLWDALGAINDGPEKRDMVPGYKRTGGEDLLRASLLYYYFLLYDVLQRPSSGLYELQWDGMGKQHWYSTEPAYVSADSVTATIPPGPGWGWQDKWLTQYDQQAYYDKLLHIGVELDKIIAYELLSIPAALNEYLWHEKANGNSYWSDLWTNNGRQLWKVTRAFITDNFNHDQNPYCMDADGNLITHPVDLLEGPVSAGFIEKDIFDGEIRCAPGSYPVMPGMDALYAIYAIFYGLSGSQHPWYHNGLSDYMDSQVKGGNHRFDIPEGAEWAEFTNANGTKTYQAANTKDGLSISYPMVLRGQGLKNRMDLMNGCNEGLPEPTDPAKLVGTFGRNCTEILACANSATPPAYCDQENWDGIFLYPSLGTRDLDRIEAMLIMMQDMIDLAGHYAWYTPGYLEEP